jgi:two-component system, LuxR family, response regulator FixJ
LTTLHRGERPGKLKAPSAIVHVVDDDEATGEVVRLLLKTVGLQAATYTLPSRFIQAFDPSQPGCVVLDLRMPELSGIETLTWLRTRARSVPVIFISGYGDLATVTRVMKLGAVEFIEKPFNKELLIEAIQHWVRSDIAAYQTWRQHKLTLDRLQTLSSRERQVLECVLKGMSNKETARHLGVSPKAIEIYRGNLMRKMGSDNVVELVTRISGCLKCAGDPLIWPPCLTRIDPEAS